MLVCFTTACYSEGVTLVWTLSGSEPLGPAGGYRIYQAKTSQTYTAIPAYTVASGVDTVTFSVPTGTYFWVATAIDNDGNESPYSNEVTAKIRPGAPGNLFRLTIPAIEKAATPAESPTQ